MRTKNMQTLRSLLSDEDDLSGIDLVINFLNDFDRSECPSTQMHFVNVELPCRICELIQVQNPNLQWIQVSSTWQYAPATIPNLPYYCETKREASDTLSKIIATGNSLYTEYLVGDVFGVGDPRNKIPSLCVNNFRWRCDVTVTGGYQTIEPMFVTDVARTLLHFQEGGGASVVRLQAKKYHLYEFREVVNQIFSREVMSVVEGPVNPFQYWSLNHGEPIGARFESLPSFEQAIQGMVDRA